MIRSKPGKAARTKGAARAKGPVRSKGARVMGASRTKKKGDAPAKDGPRAKGDASAKDDAREEERFRRKEVPADVRVARGSRALVAIVGRPNVGKSTLFNRMVGKHLAIVEDTPGVTRDRHYADAELRGRQFVVVDTGGFDPEGKDPVVAGIRNQVRLAIAEADVAVFVTDATVPLTDADLVALDLLRRSERPVIYVANKADSPKRDADAFELYSAGVSDVIPVSALHGRGFEKLEDAILSKLPPPEAEDVILADDIPRVAVVGRPNAGKSSLINRLVGQDRLIVDSRPGTTTDAIDTMVEKNGKKYVFVDTAGMRRKRSVSAPVELTSVMQAIRTIERADVVVLLFDATEEILSDQDLRIIALAEERGRAIMIGLNKVDKLSAQAEKKVVQTARERISFAAWIPILRLSAKEGRGTSALLDQVDKVYESFSKRVGTGEVNRFFEEVIEKHPPPVQNNRSVRLYYVSQVGVRPPRFAAVSNFPESIAVSYDRYLKNQMRERFGFEGVPIRISYKAKRKKQYTGEREE
ncbi:MAG: ribosome biogenesis GTPase Der [Polyangiales bacterium]